jgi:hypothetical protein
MSLLQFMPWCPISQIHNAAEISIIPFDRDNECVDLVCFSGLANREYFNQLGAYCNTDCFTLYGQRFGDDPSFTGLTSRRREGRNIDGRALAETTFTIPVHASSVREVNLDEKLLSSLINYRSSSLNNHWSRWQNAISCFNQANTDNDTVRYQVEWLLLCSAFEHLLSAKSEAKDVARKFTDLFSPTNPLLLSGAKRKSNKKWDTDKPLRFEWMREFYRIRGDFAHGKLITRQSTAWEPLEHLVLATISFPLLVRVLLSTLDSYALSDSDQARIDAFELVANEAFLKPPHDQKNSMDSWLSRLTREATRNLAKLKAFQMLEPKALENESENQQ